MLRSYHYGDFPSEVTNELLRARFCGHLAYCHGYPDSAEKCPLMIRQKWARTTADIRAIAWHIGFTDAHLAMADLTREGCGAASRPERCPKYHSQDAPNRVARWYGYWHAIRGLDASPWHDTSFADLYRKTQADHRPEVLRWWMQGYDDAARQEQELLLDKKPSLYPRKSANTGNPYP